MFIASLVGHKFEKALPRSLRAARGANNAVFEAYHENGGTTLSCLVFQQSEVVALNVGDSRIYQLRSGGVSQLTTDDTIANQMRQLRAIDPGLSNPSLGKQLTQFIGMGQDVQFRHFDPRKNSDVTGFLLTSDGVHGMSAETFRDLALYASSPLDVVKRLTTVARWGRSNDNGTVVCVGREVDMVTQEEGSSSERLLIWDSYSRLDILLDSRTWTKDRRGKSTGAKKSSQRKSGQGQLNGPPDLHAGVAQNTREASDAERKTGNEPKQPNGAGTTDDKPSKREPLQLEIIEQTDDKSPD
jgi:serine/threonine protein phosphatase PrpC